jgi:hypothetical protein
MFRRLDIMQSRLLSLGIAMEFGQEMSLNLTKLFGELFAELLKVALRCGFATRCSPFNYQPTS